MKNIKTYENFGSNKDISEFLDLVYNDVKNKVGNIYDLFQDYEDEGYKMEIDIGVKGPDYEKDYNIDIIGLFSIDSDLTISDSIDKDYGSYVQWILGCSFELLLDDITFTIFFTEKNANPDNLMNVVDDLLPKLASMFDYTYISHNVVKNPNIVRLICQL